MTSYTQQLALFDLALQQHGCRVDHAVYSTGITQPPSRSRPCATPPRRPWCASSTPTSPARCTLRGSPSSKSLTLLASAQTFLEVPGLYGYSASKHGLLGLMRSLRVLGPAARGVRVNLIAPSGDRHGHDCRVRASVSRPWDSAE